jgi:hypothetical protein
MARPAHRPSSYTDEIAHEICETIAHSNRGIDYLCSKHKSWPDPKTVMRWLSQQETFRQRYADARARQADFIFDECLEIADDVSGDGERGDNGKETQHATEQVARSKLRVDTRKWIAARLAPKKYGEQIAVEHGAADSLLNALKAMADD